MRLNELLWTVPNELGWWFWLPFMGYALYALNKMYRLAPAVTKLGRFIRVLFTIAFVSLIFMPNFNGLGPYAFHLLTIGICLWLKQTYADCVRDGKITKPQGETVIEKVHAFTVEIKK